MRVCLGSFFFYLEIFSSSLHYERFYQIQTLWVTVIFQHVNNTHSILLFPALNYVRREVSCNSCGTSTVVSAFDLWLLSRFSYAEFQVNVSWYRFFLGGEISLVEINLDGWICVLFILKSLLISSSRVLILSFFFPFRLLLGLILGFFFRLFTAFWTSACLYFNFNTLPCWCSCWMSYITLSSSTVFLCSVSDVACLGSTISTYSFLNICII